MEEIHWDPETNGSEMLRRPIADSLREETAKWHDRLLDQISSHSDEITGLFLEGKAVPPEVLKRAIRKETIARNLIPVFCGGFPAEHGGAAAARRGR